MNQDISALEFNWKRPQTFFAVALAAITSSRQFFSQMPRTGGALPPILFFLSAQLIPALVTFVYYLPQGPGTALTRLAYNLGAPLLMAVACAVLLYVAVQIFARESSLTLEQALRIVCYSCGILLVSFVPWFMSPMAGLLLSAFMFILIVYLIGIGLRVVGGLQIMQMVLALSLSLLVVGSTYLWLKPGKATEIAPTSESRNAAPSTNQPDASPR